MANSSVCLDAFQTIVLPWLREHFVLPGAALVRMGNVHRSFLLCESASQYFGDWIVTRTSFGCIVHQVGPPCVAYRLYHADCLQRCFLRRISCSSKPPAITGSFAVSEYLRAKVRSRWVPNDIDTFIDDASLFWEYIRVYREMVLSPLGIKDHLYLSAAYNEPSLVLDVTGDVTVREIAAAASAATIVRVWPISSVWRAVTEWLNSYDASTSLSVGVLRAFRFINDRHPKVVEQMPAEPTARATAIAFALRERASGWRVAPRRLVAPAHPTAEGHRKWLSRSNAIRTHASHATGSSATRSHGLALAVVGSLGLRHSDNTAGSSNTIRQRGRAPTAVARPCTEAYPQASKFASTIVVNKLYVRSGLHHCALRMRKFDAMASGRNLKDPAKKKAAAYEHHCPPTTSTSVAATFIYNSGLLAPECKKKEIMISHM